MFNKKILSLIFVSIIFLSLFVVVVSAQINQDNGRSELQEFKEKIADGAMTLFGWNDKSKSSDSTSSDNFLLPFDQSGGIAKFLIFILVFLVLYSLGEFLPFTERTDRKTSWIFIGICLVVSILSTLYLEKWEITSLINNYKVLGYLITLIVPLIVVTSISKKFYAKDHGFMAKYIWLGFIIVFLYLNFENLALENAIIYLSVLAYAFAMFFLHENVFKVIEKLRSKYDALESAHTAQTQEYESLKAQNNSALTNIAGIQNDLLKAKTSMNEVLINSTMDSRTKDELIKSLNTRIDSLLDAQAASAKVIEDSKNSLNRARTKNRVRG